jgi:hypothetical protein
MGRTCKHIKKLSKAGSIGPTRSFAAISEPRGISERAFVTFPEYQMATGWHFQTILF